MDNFFQALSEVVSDKIDLTMTFRKRGDLCCVSVLPKVRDIEGAKNDSDTDLRPISIRGTAQEIDEGIIQALSEVSQPLSNYVSDLEDYAKNLSKKSEQLSKKSESPSREKRLKGKLDEKDRKTLIDIPCTDPNFKAALKRASLPTLKEAYEQAGKTNSKRIAAEIKRLTGKPLKEIVPVHSQKKIF